MALICVSMNNQPCLVRPTLIDLNDDGMVAVWLTNERPYFQLGPFSEILTIAIEPAQNLSSGLVE